MRTTVKAKENGNSIAQAREVIEKEAKERGEICSAEINLLLQKYNCQMFAAVQVGGELHPIETIIRLPCQVAVEAKLK